MDSDLKMLLQHSVIEIQELRRRNEILEARDEVVTTFSRLLALTPQQSRSQCVDVVWMLQQELEKAERIEEEKVREER